MTQGLLPEERAAALHVQISGLAWRMVANREFMRCVAEGQQDVAEGRYRIFTVRDLSTCDD